MQRRPCCHGDVAVPVVPACAASPERCADGSRWLSRWQMAADQAHVCWC